MAKRIAQVSCLILLVSSVAFTSGCRAFNSSYSNPEADLAAKPKPAANESKPGDKPTDGASGSESAPTVDYKKDTTECKTPDGVTVGKNPGALMANSGWALPVDGDQVSVTATKKGPYSADISIQKSVASKAETVSFTVKQTAADKFSACNFKYTFGSGGEMTAVTGSVMVDRLNAVDATASTIVNSGAFDLNFARAASAAKVQSIYLGATSPSDMAGTEINGSYFTDSTAE